MITGLEFNKLAKEKIKMYELTKNTMVLCNNSDLKYKVVQEFLKIEKDNGGVTNNC